MEVEAWRTDARVFCRFWPGAAALYRWGNDWQIGPPMSMTRTLLNEENPVSLCRAFVLDDGYVASFGLLPRHLLPTFPGDSNWGKYKGTSLYRRSRSLLARLTLAPLGEHQEWAFNFSRSRHKPHSFRNWVAHVCYCRFLISLEKDIKVAQFGQEPNMRFCGLMTVNQWPFS